MAYSCGMEQQDPDVPLAGVGIVQHAPRSARVRARREARLRRRPLVRADGELRAVALSWVATGVICVVAAILLGSLGHLSPLEFWATLFALFIPPLATAGTLLLGRRTPRGMLYRLLLDKAPAPPPDIRPEPVRRTAARAGVAAVCLGFGLLPFIAAGMGFELAAMGKPPDEIPNHLVEAASLVDGVWLLACAAAAELVGRWIIRWEQERGRAALCPPLHSGLLSPVYFAIGGRALVRERDPSPARGAPAGPAAS